MEKSPENSAIEQNAELGENFHMNLSVVLNGHSMASDSATEENKPTRQGKPHVITENMIRLRRKFDFSTRPRPKALAIIHPETRTVLYPGIEKITDDKIEESVSRNEGNSAQVDHQYIGVFQSMQQHQINQVSENRKLHNHKRSKFHSFILPEPQQDQSTLNLQYDPRHQFNASCQDFLSYYDLPFNTQREP